MKSTAAARIVRAAKRSRAAFPLVARFRCECCGLEGVDEVTQWAVEEAAYEVAAIHEAKQRASTVTLPDGMSMEETPEERHRRIMREIGGGS